MRRATLSMFAQIVKLLPQSLFFKLVQKNQTDKGPKGISTKDQLIAMMLVESKDRVIPNRFSLACFIAL